jgi:hypothetical protein
VLAAEPRDRPPAAQRRERHLALVLRAALPIRACLAQVLSISLSDPSSEASRDGGDAGFAGSHRSQREIRSCQQRPGVQARRTLTSLPHKRRLVAGSRPASAASIAREEMCHEGCGRWNGKPGDGSSAEGKRVRNLAHVTDTLALAFYDDPVLMWIVDDGSRREQLLPAFFGAVAESYLGYDETYVVNEGVSAAVWAPPGAEDDEDLPAVLGESVEEYAPRLFEVLGLMEAKHPVEPLFYLFLLGTRPGWQGRRAGVVRYGSGSREMRSRRCAGVPGGHQRAQQAALPSAWLK